MCGCSWANPVAKPTREEGTNACACPAVDVDDERRLDAIALGNEDQVVSRPQGTENPGQVSLSKVVVWSMFIDDDTLESQRTTDPLDT